MYSGEIVFHSQKIENLSAQHLVTREIELVMGSIDKYRYFPFDTSHYMKTLKKYRETFKKYWKKTERFWNNFRNILKDTGKTKKIVGDFSTKFGSTAENIRKFLKFLNDFIELLKILMLGNNISWKLQGKTTLILQKLWMNIWVNLINFAEVMKKFWKRFLKF